MNNYVDQRHRKCHCRNASRDRRVVFQEPPFQTAANSSSFISWKISTRWPAGAGRNPSISVNSFKSVRKVAHPHPPEGVTWMITSRLIAQNARNVRGMLRFFLFRYWRADDDEWSDDHLNSIGSLNAQRINSGIWKKKILKINWWLEHGREWKDGDWNLIRWVSQTFYSCHKIS